MRRREFLGTGLGAAAVLAGCMAPTRRSDVEAQQSLETGRTLDLPVQREALHRSVPKDEIPAITGPAFGDDWASTQTTSLAPHDRVIGIEFGEEARAYPLRVLNWHEVVNDVGPLGDPLLVTYCPLCASGITASRIVRGHETVFGVSGLLWNSNLVMYDDRTNSLWSQIDALAIRGPVTGEILTLVPSMITTWGEWRDSYENTRVLLPPPDSTVIRESEPRDYAVDPYSMYDPYDGYRAAGETGGSDVERIGGFPHPKEWVLGITVNGHSKAYPLIAVVEAGPVNDRVGNRPIVVTVGADGWTLIAYDRNVESNVLRFEEQEGSGMRAGGSRWSVPSGKAVDGPYEGGSLARVPGRSMFWFAWVDRFTKTSVFIPDG